MNMRGRWYRWQKKLLVDDYLALDMAIVAKRIDLEVSGSYVWCWTNSGVTGTSSVSILITVIPGHELRLQYKYNGEEIDLYRISIVTTRPHFGGKRYWFLCPNQSCRRRVRILYAGRYFLCRQCRNLTYATAQSGGNLITTIDSRLAFLRRKLGGRGSLLDVPWDKPSRMHFRTYMRLTGEYINLLRIREQAFNCEISHMLPLSDGNMLINPKAFKDDLAQEWKTYKTDPEWPPFWDGHFISLSTIERATPEKSIRLTLGELAKAAGVSYTFAQEAMHESLLRPDGGRKTRTKRYRPKLATWLRKLYRLREAGLSWSEIRDWSRRRWQPEYEHERKWPAGTEL